MEVLIADCGQFDRKSFSCLIRFVFESFSDYVSNFRIACRLQFDKLCFNIF